MSNLTVIENKITILQKYLKILDRYKNYSVEEIEKNVDIRGAVERYLQLACQATIDLAESYIAYKKLRKPSTMSEAFYILNEEQIITNELTEKMISMTGFRNVLTHDYEKVNYTIVHTVLHEGVEDIKQFIHILEQKL